MVIYNQTNNKNFTLAYPLLVKTTFFTKVNTAKETMLFLFNTDRK
ncbi:hypothetical protein BG07_5094 [Bacillus pseudomycoides]|nr:hypothetical protein DJ92_5214 [Bacillus pseudomycoides]AJI14945.1 hypothetical protein BG07_5094 [Bacillus pseudomycoides]KFN15298.1 hypothetical protein DJ94_1040 [Bacillus pseudomycoides]